MKDREERLTKLIDVAKKLLHESAWIAHEGYNEDYFSCRWCGKNDYTKRHHELDCPYLNFKKEYALIVLDQICEEDNE